MRKLLPKIASGSAGGCPLLVFGITQKLYVDDAPGVAAGELAGALGDLVAAAAALPDHDA
jgi:hypothetical protein